MRTDFGRLAAWLVLGMAPAHAQAPGDHLYPIREGRKIGFINRSGTAVVAPTYDAAGDLKEGRIRVTAGNLSGFIDLSGKVVIQPKFENAGDFRDGRAVVFQGGKYALIDPSGRVVAEIPYRVLGDFHQGLLRVQAAGRVDANGKRLPTLYGFVDREGRTAIQPQFIPASEFPDDPADLPFGGLDNDWCYFDRTGKIVIRVPIGTPMKGANLFSGGRLRVKEGFTWGYLDASGKWAIPPKYNDAGDFKAGVARVQDGAKWIEINIFGKEVPESKKKVVAIEPVSEGLALAREDDLLGWIDARERLAFPLRKYEEAHSFSCGLARIKLDDLYGYLDKSGNLAIPNRYLSAADFDHDLALVETREGLAYIDTKGAVVWKSASRP